MLGFVLAPIVLMFLTAFKTQAQIFDTQWVWIFIPTLNNFHSVINEGQIHRYLTNSLIVSSIATIVCVWLGTLCAYGIARFHFPGRGILAYSSLLLRTIPPTVLAIPMFIIWSNWGINDSLSGLTLAYVALNLPFVIWLLYTFIIQVPIELEEAASVDGCGPFRIFWLIVFPLLRPGLAAAALFCFRLSWNEFILSFILTNRHTRTLPASIANYITDTGVEWGQVMAAGCLIALPPLLLGFVAAKQMISGLAQGAVKS